LQQVPSSISQDLPDLQQEFQQQQQHATSQQQQQLGSSQQRLQQLDLQQPQQRQQQQQQGMGMSPSLPPGFGSSGFMPPGFQIGMGNRMTAMRASAGFGGKDQQLQPDMSSKWLLAALVGVALQLGLYACAMYMYGLER
jgi:hypothetical protein